MSHHKKRFCLIKKLFDRTHTHITKLIDSENNLEIIAQNRIEEYRRKILLLEQKNLILEEINSSLIEENKKLHEVINASGQNSEVNPNNLRATNISSIISKMNIKDTSKYQYMKVWGNYSGWCKIENKNPFIPQNANNYILYLLEQNTNTKTVKNRRSYIQTILIEALNIPVSLKRIRIVKRTKNKTFLTKDQLNEYLESQKENPVLYTIQYLQAHEGLRINAASNIQFKHLKFLNYQDNHIVTVPDSKTGKFKKPFKNSTISVLKEYLKSYSASDGYIFPCPVLKHTSHEKRASYFMKKINYLMGKYVETHPEIKKLSTHDLRRTYCQNTFNHLRSKIVGEVQKSLNHKNIRTTELYLKKEECFDIIPDTVLNQNASQNIEIINSQILCHNSGDQNFQPTENFEENQIDNGENNLTCKNLRKGKCQGPTWKIAKVTPKQEQEFRESFNIAMKSRGYVFCEDLKFESEVELPNNYLSKIQELSETNQNIYHYFKKRSRKGIYAPLKIEYDTKQGYVVKATKQISRLTLICEYVGKVVNHDQEENDSLMEYATYKDIALVIDPSQYCNLARFISGINTTNHKGRNKKNLGSIKFRIDEQIHVMLYATKNIKKNDTLYYDYRAGEIKEYDTSNFE